MITISEKLVWRRHIEDKGNAGFMGSINVTGYCADNFFILVQDHIQDKADSRSFAAKSISS